LFLVQIVDRALPDADHLVTLKSRSSHEFARPDVYAPSRGACVISLTFTNPHAIGVERAQMPQRQRSGPPFRGYFRRTTMHSRKSISKTSKRPAVEFLVTDDELDRVSGGAALGASARMTIASGGTSVISGGNIASGGFAASGGFVGASGGFVGASGGKQ
jgi:hypothetical protein